MSGTNMVLWPGTCPARPGLRYATDLGEATATNYFVCMYVNSTVIASIYTSLYSGGCRGGKEGANAPPFGG